MTPKAQVPPRSSAALLALLASLSIAGCRGCTEEDAPAPIRASKLSPIETRRVSIMDRRAARKIDPAKKLVVDAAGVTQCAKDIDCFVLTAERCAASVLDHTQVITMFGIEQTASARYTIVGEADGSCELHRELQGLEMKLHPELVAALKSKGKTDDDLAKMQADGYEQLKQRNPKHLDCRFAGDETLEVVLDMAESKYEPRLWRDRCKVVEVAQEGAGEGKAAPEAPAAPAPAAEPPAAPAPSAR